MKPMRLFEIILRLILGGVFVYAGVVKALDPIVFLEEVRAYRLLVDPYSALVALFLPWLEILAGLGVISRVLYAGSLASIGGMLAAFLVGITSARVRGLDISCGCFGNASSKVTDITPLVLDICLIAICAFLFFRAWSESRAAKS